MNLSAWAVRHRALVGFLIALLFVGGSFSYLRLGRAEDPTFTLKVMIVTAVWPGATAAEMQDQVAERIERKLQDLAYLAHLDTYVRPGFAAITVTLRDDTPPRLVADLWYQVRKKLTDMRGTLPGGVQGPNANDEYSDVYGAVFALTGADNAELVRHAERIRDRLLRVPGAEKVIIEGERPRAVFVEFNHARLATLGVAPTDVINALARQNAVAPAGVVETGSTRVAVRADGALTDAASVADVPVAVGGRSLRLGDISTIRMGYADPPSFLVRQNGVPAVVLAVSMARGTNGVDFGTGLRAEAARIQADLPLGLELAQIADQSRIIEESVSDFLLKFGMALGVVLLVSFASLGFRTGIVVALSVPLTLAVVFVVMQIVGLELQRITLGALIISLGLLVDDAIIAIETMVVKMEEGWDRVAAATHAWSSTAFPMLSGTLVTAAGFVPVGFAASSAGEYAGGIFWVVGLALLVSWIVAVVFTPFLGVLLLPTPKRHVAHDDQYATRTYRVLRAAVAWCVQHRILVVAATAGLFVVAGAGMGMVKKQFFPSSARPELLLDITLRQGASIQASAEAAARVERELSADPDVLWHTTYIGAGSPRFVLTFNPDLPNDAFAKIVVQTPNAAARDRVRARLQAFATGPGLPEARLRVNRLELGPPVGFPVQFRVVGADLDQVRRVSDQVLDILRSTPGTRDAQLAWGERTPQVRLELDQARVRQLGLAPAEIAQSLGSLLSGVTATQIRAGTKLIDVVLRATDAERADLASLPDLTIATAAGPVPLAQIARVVPVMEEPILWRRDRQSFIGVRADVQDGFQAPDVSAAAEARLAALRADLPSGVRIETGGATEESAKANAALAAVFPVMIIAMALLLMIQLQHIGRTLMVLATAPLGIIGAAFALLATDSAFGFVAILGVIALAGMIMRNTIILVDQVRQDMEHGLDLRSAIIESTVRRARPVVLTALAAVLAFIPLAVNVFWGPMAIALIGGLAVATLLTLAFLPALYALCFRAPRRARVAPADRRVGFGALAPAE